MNLTRDNYRSAEAEAQYMGWTQWKNWLKCPARAKAILEGRWVEPASPALAIGSLVDAMLTDSGEQARVEAKHADILFKSATKDQIAEALATSGRKCSVARWTIAGALEEFPDLRNLRQPTAAWEWAQKVATAARADKVFASYLAGEHQVIVSGEIGGCPWKGRLDVENADEMRLCDLKVTADRQRRVWTERRTIFNVLAERDGDGQFSKSKPVPWYEGANYWGQAAVYRELHRQARKLDAAWDFFLLPITRQDPPGKLIGLLKDPQRFQDELAEIVTLQPQVWKWKRGEEDVPQCWEETDGDCAYCRSVETTPLVELKSFWTRNDG